MNHSAIPLQDSYMAKAKQNQLTIYPRDGASVDVVRYWWSSHLIRKGNAAPSSPSPLKINEKNVPLFFSTLLLNTTL